MTVTTANSCVELAPAGYRTRPEGLDRAVMLVGVALTGWANRHADARAMRRRRAPLSELSDAEQADLYREASELREAAYAQRSSWHVTG